MSVQQLDFIKEDAELVLKLDTNYYKKLKAFFFRLLNSQPDPTKALQRIVEEVDDITNEEAMISVLIHLINEMEVYAQKNNLLEKKEVDIKDLSEN